MLQNYICRFLQNQGSAKHTIHQDSWITLCHMKIDGGIGLRDLSLFNQVMIVKSGWKIITDSTSFLALVLQQKYFPDCSFFKAVKGKNQSFLWTSLLWGRYLLNAGIGWKVRSGVGVKVWEDKQIPSSTYFKHFGNNSGNYSDLWVADLIDQQEQNWNLEVISHIFRSIDRERITAIHIHNTTEPELMVLRPHKKDIFTGKSTYFFAININNSCPSSISVRPHDWSKLWNFAWATMIPARVGVLLWRVVRDKLPCKITLAKRGIMLDLLCILYTKYLESTIHILFQCDFIKMLWGLVLCYIDLPKFANMGSDFQINAWKQMNKMHFILGCPFSQTIWKSRNNLIFNKKGFSIQNFKQEWYNNMTLANANFTVSRTAQTSAQTW